MYGKLLHCWLLLLLLVFGSMWMAFISNSPVKPSNFPFAIIKLYEWKRRFEHKTNYKWREKKVEEHSKREREDSIQFRENENTSNIPVFLSVWYSGTLASPNKRTDTNISSNIPSMCWAGGRNGQSAQQIFHFSYYTWPN